jgi:di/tricarboxylate transporter
LLVSLSSALLSLFMNNIAAVGVLLPTVNTISRKSGVSPSRLLIPLAFGTILGGMATLLTTSNIIVSGALREAGFASFGLLDYFPIGGPVMILGILYLTFFGKRLLSAGDQPDRITDKRDFSERLSELFQVNNNLIQIELDPTSPLAGLSIAEGNWSNRFGINILAIIRGRQPLFAPPATTIVSPGDILITKSTLTPEKALNLKLTVKPADLTGFRLSDESHPLAEILITPHSRMIGKTIREIGFRERFSLNVLGIWRAGKPLENECADAALHFGDALLVQGPTPQIRHLRQNTDIVVLEEDPDAVVAPRKGLATILITLAVLVVAAIGILPVSLLAIAGALLLILIGSMRVNDAYHGIEWKAIFLIAGLWPLSIALQKTGLAGAAITSLLDLLGPVSPILLVAIFLILTILLTLMIGGQVSAIVMIPLALVAAQTLGVPPQPFAMAVAMGCSLAFISPLGHPVNIMIMSPGGYTFKDFLRVGAPLTILAIAVIIPVIAIFWGL